MTPGFDYPTLPHTRRHGPAGYKTYESYREWLRDEFTFRCVYCLHREAWYGRPTAFNIEHVTPVSVAPYSSCHYENLVYACSTCNNAKRALLNIPDPDSVAFGDCLRVEPNGKIEALNSSGETLVDALRMNRPKSVSFRSKIIRILAALKNADKELYLQLLGFPEDLPDLRNAKAPENTKPDGAENCYFVQRENGCLPEKY